MPRLTNERRLWAIGMLEGGLSQREVSRRLGCSQPTISKLVVRYSQTRTVNDRTGSGRPRVTTPSQDRYIRLQHLRERFRTASATASETIGIHNRRISNDTIRRRLRNVGLVARRPYKGPVLTAALRRKSFRWCRHYLNVGHNSSGWSQVLFTDESRFWLSLADGRQRTWCIDVENVMLNAALRNSIAWEDQVWWFGLASVLSSGRPSSSSMATWHLPAISTRSWNHMSYPSYSPTQASASCSKTTRVLTVPRRRSTFFWMSVEVLPWPSYSPDFNPIEHLWDELGRRLRLRRRQPVNRQTLIRALQEEWERIRQRIVQKLVLSMRRRLIGGMKAFGGHTRYWAVWYYTNSVLLSCFFFSSLSL